MIDIYTKRRSCGAPYLYEDFVGRASMKRPTSFDAQLGYCTLTNVPSVTAVIVTTRFTNRFNFRTTIKYMMNPGIRQHKNPRIINKIINHGILGFPSNVTECEDWLVTRHLPSVEKNCTALIATSSPLRSVFLLAVRFFAIEYCVKKRR
jgi:hypothetical protein